MGPKIAAAVLPLGLPATSLTALIDDLAADNQTALGSVPGITPQIIGAGVEGLREAYSLGFRFVWIAAGCFMVLATICKFEPYPSPIQRQMLSNPTSFSLSLITLL